MRLIWLAAVVMILSLVCFGGCGSPESSGIVATTGMVADIVRVVGGDRAPAVTTLIDTDPHGYNPGRDDMKKLTSAEVVFYSGLLLEGRMTEAFESLARKGKPIHAVAASMPKDYLLHPTEGHPDPHVWMDVEAWSKCVGFVADKLAAYDSANAGYYRNNAKQYQAKLDELHEYVKRVIGSIPEENRYMVSSHDAFEYFERAYDLPAYSPLGIDTTVEPSIGDVEDLVKLLVENEIKVVFGEHSVNDKWVKVMTEGAAQQGWKVGFGGRLYSDTLGPKGTYEGTYIGMMDHNATTIARALGGEAPAGGMQGKLSAAKAQ